MNQQLKSAAYKPAWWCRGGHMQTLWPYLFRQKPRINYQRERLTLPDGDHLDIDWVNKGHGNRPILLILHGLEGSSSSHYIRGIVSSCLPYQWRIAVMHFRGCSGEPNKLPRSYHSGETGDLNFIVETLRTGNPGMNMAILGFSLGGNVLLKWLSEKHDYQSIKAAVAVSVPMQLDLCATRMRQGFSRLYQRHLIKHLHNSVYRKSKIMDLPVNIGRLNKFKSLWKFDDAITAPLHGFKSAEEYYRLSSSKDLIKNIGVETLIIHSRNDPFMTPDVIPEASNLPQTVQLEVYNTGGHVGFVSGMWPWQAKYWLDERIPLFLSRYLTDKQKAGT